MRIEKKIESFKNRLIDVFGDDLTEIEWELKVADKFEDMNKDLKETYFLFIDKKDKYELTLTVNKNVSLPLLRLTKKNEAGEKEIFGYSTEKAVLTHDKTKMENLNNEALEQLEDQERSVFKRLHHYVGLKIDEFIY